MTGRASPCELHGGTNSVLDQTYQHWTTNPLAFLVYRPCGRISICESLVLTWESGRLALWETRVGPSARRFAPSTEQDPDCLVTGPPIVASVGRCQGWFGTTSLRAGPVPRVSSTPSSWHCVGGVPQGLIVTTWSYVGRRRFLQWIGLVDETKEAWQKSMTTVGDCGYSGLTLRYINRGWLA